MVAQQQQTKKTLKNPTKSKSSSGQSSQTTEKEKKIPPFANSPGKLGDMKQWNGKTYYWCPANHKHSDWHTHKVEECNTYKKMIKEKNNSNNDDQKKVTVDEDKLKKGMAAIFPSGDFNTDGLAEALAAAIAGIERLLLLWFWWTFTTVNMFFYLFLKIYGLTRHWRPKRRPKQHTNYPFRRRPPRKPNRRASPGRTYINVCIWIPCLLMVLSAIQSPRRPTWTNRRVRHTKFFFLPGVDWCITTVNSSLTRRRVPKALLSFFCPTKPPIIDFTNPCMMSMRDSPSAPRQIKFDTDSQKFLIDSGASAHLWNRRKDFIYYRPFSHKKERTIKCWV